MVYYNTVSSLAMTLHIMDGLILSIMLLENLCDGQTDSFTLFTFNIIEIYRDSKKLYIWRLIPVAMWLFLVLHPQYTRKLLGDSVPPVTRDVFCRLVKAVIRYGVAQEVEFHHIDHDLKQESAVFWEPLLPSDILQRPSLSCLSENDDAHLSFEHSTPIPEDMDICNNDAASLQTSAFLAESYYIVDEANSHQEMKRQEHVGGRSSLSVLRILKSIFRKIVH